MVVTGLGRPTREVVRQRLEAIPEICFFNEEEERLLWAVTERIMPQPNRPAEQKVPIVAWIDEKLFKDERDGYHYEEILPSVRHGGLALLELTKRRSCFWWEDVCRSRSALPRCGPEPGRPWCCIRWGLANNSPGALFQCALFNDCQSLLLASACVE